MTGFDSLYRKILGDIKGNDSEKYYLTVACLLSPFYMLFLCAVHLLMGLPAQPAICVMVAATGIFILYFLIWFWNFVFAAKILLSIGSLIAIDLTWYFKFMSVGPVLFFLFLAGSMIQWVWNGRALMLLFAFYILNVIVLAYVEYNTTPAIIENYDHHLRSLDIYLSFLLYAALMIFLLNIVKKDYIKQKESVIRADKLKSAFLANMSHEIRTPLNAIMGFSHLLGMEIRTENVKKYTSIIQNNGNTLLQLINDIVDLSKIEVGELVIFKKDFNIRELFEELKISYVLELEKRDKSNIIIDYHLPHDDLSINSDPLRLKQILSNLINNAVKFTCSGQISFSCEKNYGEFLFSVSDTGTGIPIEDQVKIFERFIKFNYDGLNTEGTGIGLSIVEKLVYLLDGKIWLESQVGKGSVFYFTVPDQTRIPRKQTNQSANQNPTSQII